ncbi:MAG: GNAT family N-acetyltransferase [Pseudomonadales bacterium]|nr:GNAT family N-acetyltransferase [Pseudomonadales bacterium]
MEQDVISFHQLNPFLEFNQTKSIWLGIEKNAVHSYYLSWAWMGNWLECLSEQDKVVFVFGICRSKPVFCYFLGLTKGFDSKFIYSKRAYLNGTGDPSKDAISIEHNGILIDQVFKDDNRRSIFQKTDCWDEMVARSLCATQIEHFTAKLTDFHCRIENENKAFYVDLDQVRDSKNDLLPLLSKNKRSQIRRSLKAYEQDGPLRIEIARTPEDAGTSFLNLQLLLHKRQKQKYGPDYPISDFATRFHQRLISDNCSNGSVDLVTVYAGNNVIGHLYNFVDDEGVYFNQCGFVYRPENVYRPGLVCHLMLINHYAALGYKKYDFMMGEMAYKKSLSSDSYTMPTYRLRQNKMRFKVEDRARQIKQFMMKSFEDMG